MVKMHLFHRGFRDAIGYGSVALILLGVLILAIPNILEYVIAIVLISVGMAGIWASFGSKKKYF